MNNILEKLKTREYYFALAAGTLVYFACIRFFQDWLYRRQGIDQPPAGVFASFGNFFRAEPYEIFLYLLGYLLVPVLAYVILPVIRIAVQKLKWQYFIPVIALAVALGAWWFFQKPYFSRLSDYLSEKGIWQALWFISTKRIIVALLVIILPAIAAVLYYFWGRHDLGVLYSENLERFIKKFWPAGFLLLAFLLYHPNLPLDPHHYHYFMGAVNDIYEGKGLLYESSHLYGILGVYFLAAVFKVLPFTYAMFALVVTVAHLLFFAGIFVFVRKWLGSYIFAALSLAIMVPILYFFQTSFTRSVLFFPAMGPFRWGLYLPALLCILAFARSGQKKFAHLAMLISAAALFWNFDTGVFLSVATVSALAYRELAAGWNIKSAFRVIGVFLAYAAGIFALINAVNYQIYGAWPDWSLFLRESKDFALGGAMYPLPPAGLYQILFFTYLATLLFAFYKLAKREAADLPLVFLAVFGAFSLAYYIGESTWQLFYAITSPFILIVLYAVNNFRQNNYQPQYERLAATGLAFLIFVSAALTLFKLPVEFSTRDYAKARETLLEVSEYERPSYEDGMYLKEHYRQERIPVVAKNITYLLIYSEKSNLFDFYYIFPIYFEEQMQKYVEQTRKEQPPFVVVGKNEYGNDQVEYFLGGIGDLYELHESLRTVDVYKSRTFQTGF